MTTNALTLDANQINLVGNDKQRLVGEKRLDALIQRHLLLDAVAAGFRDIDKEEDSAVKVCQCSDALHLDGVALLQRVIQNSGSVDNLQIKSSASAQ